MLRRGFPKRGRRFMSRKAIITGRAFAGNELPAKSPLCPERSQAFTQQSKQALRGIGPGLCLGSRRLKSFRLPRLDKSLRSVSPAYTWPLVAYNASHTAQAFAVSLGTPRSLHPSALKWADDGLRNYLGVTCFDVLQLFRVHFTLYTLLAPSALKWTGEGQTTNYQLSTTNFLVSGEGRFVQRRLTRTAGWNIRPHRRRRVAWARSANPEGAESDSGCCREIMSSSLEAS